MILNFILRNIRRIRRIYFVGKKINWKLFFSLYSRNGEYVVLSPSIFHGFVQNSLEIDILLAAILCKNEKTFSIVRGKNFKKIKQKKIFYSPSALFNYQNKLNYAEEVAKMVLIMEKNGNQVFYSHDEILFWENKTHMHKMFDKLSINTPETIIFSNMEDFENSTLEFPCLLKEEHSHASLGLHKLNNKEDGMKIISSENFKSKNDNIIIQRLLNIKKDLRVIFVGNEIVLNYWRINPSKEWKPTSTSHGSGVDFIFFPDKWKDHITKTFLKLKLTTGAFDIAWQNDDLDTEPYFLEVSPSYQPNPPIDVSEKKYNYGEYKKKFMFKNSWDYNYIEILYSIKSKHIKLCIEEKIK